MSETGGNAMKHEEQEHTRRPYTKPEVKRVTLVPRETLGVSPTPSAFDPTDPLGGIPFGQ